MLFNYIKIAVRSIFRNRTYSIINIFGLGLGLATGFIMLLWVNNEYGMNRFHSRADRIYEVNAKLKFGDAGDTWENVPAPVADYARANLPSVEKVARLKNYGLPKQVVKYNNTVFIESSIGYTEN